MHCKVKLLRAGICSVDPRMWQDANYRINRIHMPIEGKARYRDLNGEKLLETGSVYLLINGFSQDLSMVSGFGYKHLYLDFQSAPPLFSREILKIALSEDLYIQHLLQSARDLIEEGMGRQNVEIFDSKTCVTFDELEQLLSVILMYLQRVYGIGVVENEKIESAIRFIREHYAEQIQNADIANALHIDNRYLIRLFTHHMSMPPYQYLTQCRIERAQELLRSGKNVTETAFACGYQSETAFRIAFKRVTGCTPTALKK